MKNFGFFRPGTKYGPPIPDIQRESEIPVLVPTAQYKRERMMQFYQSLFQNIQTGKPSPWTQVPIHDENQRQALLNAVAVQLNAELTMTEDKRVNAEFVQEFQKWLRGISQFNADKVRTPWGGKRLVGPDINAYLAAFVDQKFEFQKFMAKMDLAPPANIFEAWLYFKYKVMGLDPEGMDFLQEYQWLYEPRLLDQAVKDTRVTIHPPPGATGPSIVVERTGPQNAGALYPAKKGEQAPPPITKPPITENPDQVPKVLPQTNKQLLEAEPEQGAAGNQNPELSSQKESVSSTAAEKEEAPPKEPPFPADHRFKGDKLLLEFIERNKLENDFGYADLAKNNLEQEFLSIVAEKNLSRGAADFMAKKLDKIEQEKEQLEKLPKESELLRESEPAPKPPVMTMTTATLRTLPKITPTTPPPVSDPQPAVSPEPVSDRQEAEEEADENYGAVVPVTTPKQPMGIISSILHGTKEFMLPSAVNPGPPTGLTKEQEESLNRALGARTPLSPEFSEKPLELTEAEKKKLEMARLKGFEKEIGKSEAKKQKKSLFLKGPLNKKTSEILELPSPSRQSTRSKKQPVRYGQDQK